MHVIRGYNQGRDKENEGHLRNLNIRLFYSS